MSYSAIRVCTSCDAKNRVAARHLAQVGKCGVCQASLPASAEPIEVDAAGFEDIVREARVPVLVDFWAQWCPPCRAAAPEVHALAAEMAGQALVLKVDTERHPDLAARFRVASIPNFVVMREGQIVFQKAGLAGRDQMRRWLERASMRVA